MNNLLLKRIEDAGLRIAGRSVDNKLVEIIENPIILGLLLVNSTLSLPQRHVTAIRYLLAL